MSLTQDAELAAKLLARHIAALTVPDRNGECLYDRIDHERVGHPRAATWDGGPKATIVWCELHGRDVRSCHQESWGCTGVPLNGRSDPTGDGGCGDDPAAIDLSNARKVWQRVLNDISMLANIDAAYPAPHAAGAWERQQTAEENDPRCESCCRIEVAKGIPWWVEPRTKERSTVGKRLKDPLWLCDWCENHVIQTGIIPNDDELEQHRAGKRVRCPHPKVEKKDEEAE